MKRKQTKKKQKIKYGLFWHVHHDCRAELCWDYDERLSVINRDKAHIERPLRRMLFKPVRVTGASPKLRRAILAARKPHFDPTHYGYDNSWHICQEVNKLHAKQCHPRCPMSHGRKEILAYPFQHRRWGFVTGYRLAPIKKVSK